MRELVNKPGRMTGILTLVVGVILLLWPGSTLTALCALLGWCLIGSGVLELVLGLIGAKLVFNITGGVAAIAAGIIFIACPAFIISILPLAIGIAAALGGCALLIYTLIHWVMNPWSILSVAGGAAAVIIGLVLVFNPFEAVKLLMIVLGIFLIYMGILRISHS